MQYHEITCFSNRSGNKIGKVFEKLVDLISETPEKFELKGDFCWDDDNSGKYEILKFDRNKGVAVLGKFVKWSKIMNVDQTLYIIHLGI